MSTPISQLILPHPSSLGNHKFVLYICNSISALQISSFGPFFYIPHIRDVIQCLFFSFWHTSLCITTSRSTHVSVNGTFIHFHVWGVVVYMHHIFIYPSVDGHLGCFHALDIVNSAAVNIECMPPFEFWFALDICLRVGLLDHMVALFLCFWETSILFSWVPVPICIPTNSVKRGSFSPQLL